MRVVKVKTTGKALDRDGIAQAQNLTVGALTLNGVMAGDMGIVSTVTRNLATAVTTKGSTYVSFYSGSDLHTATLTVTGLLYLENGDSITQTATVTGPNNSIVITSVPFSTVTSITSDTAIASNIEVGNNSTTASQLGEQFSVPIQCHWNTRGNTLLHGVISSGASLTYDVEVSGELNAHRSLTPQYADHTSFTGKTANYADNLIVPVTAIRTSFPANTWTSGSVSLNIVNEEMKP